MTERLAPKAIIPALADNRSFLDAAEELDISLYLAGAKRFAANPRAARAEVFCVASFLSEYDQSEETYNAYRRDLEHLLLWAMWEADASIVSLGRNELKAYLEFLSEPPVEWAAPSRKPRFLPDGRPNPAWRPFVRSPAGEDQRLVMATSKASIRSALLSISSFFTHLVDQGVAENNPVRALKQRKAFTGAGGHARNRTLTEVQWAACQQVAHEMAEEDPAAHERSLYLLMLVCRLYLRMSDVTASNVGRPDEMIPLMSAFWRDREGFWWLNLSGKGRKDRSVTVPDDVIASLKRYRIHLGLPPLPVPDEETPLVPRAKGKGGVKSTRHIRRVLQTVFDRAKDLLMERGEEDDAHAMDAVTAHWLRHTGVSNDVLVRPLAHVRDDAGHENIATTSNYINSDMRARAASRGQT